MSGVERFLPSFRTWGADPGRELVMVLHGALGSSQNWQRFVRDLAEVVPELRFVMVDIRGHGGSVGAPPPHTLEAAAADLDALMDTFGRRPAAVLGHSLGGKLATVYARLFGAGLRQLWLLDSNPGAQEADASHEVYRVLAAVRAVKRPILSRPEAIEQLVAAGMTEPLSQWLVTSLRREGNQYVWAYDLPALDGLLADYFRCDEWPYLESVRDQPEVHVVIAEHSDRWTADLRERAFTLPRGSPVRPYLLPDSGHWVHVDNPRGLLAMLGPELARI